MNTLSDALLDLSCTTQQTLRPQVVNLDRIMIQLQERTLPDLLSRDIHWQVAALPEVWGDLDALTQVLTQLTENALKFTQTREPAVIQVWAEYHGDAWRVCVQDNGLGFDPRYQNRLFNMFQRLHSSNEASGRAWGGRVSGAWSSSTAVRSSPKGRSGRERRSASPCLSVTPQTPER